MTTDDLEIERAALACRALAPVDLYSVLRAGLGERRGWHVYQVHEDGAIGCYPRTTCADVARLTALCRLHLAQHAPEALARWERVADDADRSGAGLDESAEFPRNRAYWRALRAITMETVPARPRNEIDAANAWRTVEVIDDRGTLRVKAENVVATDVKTALYFHFGERRGWETTTVQLKQRDGSIRTEQRRHPKTTCADVAQLAAFWTREIARAPQNYGDMVPGAQRKRWSAAASAVTRHCTGTPDTVYPENRAFWKAMSGAAVSIDVERDNVPRSKLDAVIGTFSDVVSAVGSGLGDAASWTGDQLVDAAGAVGKGAGNLLGGFLDAVGFKTLLIGAGVVVGAIVIVPKLIDRNQEE
jgi:hypothetical protein